MFSLIFYTFICFYNLFYRVVQNIIRLFDFGRVFLGALEPYSTSWCAAARGQPGQLHGHGVFMYHLSRVHIVFRFMQMAHRFVFMFLVFFASSYKGFAAWFHPLICSNLADWVCSPYCFFCVISFTLLVEIFLDIL